MIYLAAIGAVGLQITAVALIVALFGRRYRCYEPRTFEPADEIEVRW